MNHSIKFPYFLSEYFKRKLILIKQGLKTGILILVVFIMVGLQYPWAFIRCLSSRNVWTEAFIYKGFHSEFPESKHLNKVREINYWNVVAKVTSIQKQLQKNNCVIIYLFSTKCFLSWVFLKQIPVFIADKPSLFEVVMKKVFT